jgi:hypothetical protein
MRVATFDLIQHPTNLIENITEGIEDMIFVPI